MDSSPLWTTDDLVWATSGSLNGPKRQAIGVSIDSRAVRSGDVFIALKGPKFNGHDYVVSAFKAGASVAIVSERPKNIKDDMSLVVVQDTFIALQDMARFARARSTAKVIGITGSVGKTSVKEMLAFVLSKQGQTHATIGNLNNHYGVPLTLARLPKHACFAVIEMGMSAPGEIGPLSQLVQPDVALVTAIAPAHLENFPDMAGIAYEKADIVQGLKPRGALVLNRDSQYFAHMMAHVNSVSQADIYTFGETEKSDSRLRQCALQAFGSTVLASVEDTDVVYRLGLSGKHQVLNSLAVLQACVLIGADLIAALSQMVKLSPVKGRGQVIHIQNNSLSINVIDDSYNASPASMKAALGVLSAAETGGRRIAVLGDMLELGSDEIIHHTNLRDHLIELDITKVYLCGSRMKHLWDILPESVRGAYAETSERLSEKLISQLKDKDMVLVKGSYGSRMRVLVTALCKLNTKPNDQQEAKAHAL